MAVDSYPFTGLDMLQQSMSGLIAELRNVTSALGSTARSLGSGTLQETSRGIGTTAQNIHASMIAGATQITAGGGGGGSLFSETFSSQFNKPSLWSRDLLAMSGLKNHDDMQGWEAERYASHNMGQRGKMFGLGAARTASLLPSLLLKSTGVGMAAGFAIDYTAGEFIKNAQQENEWWGYLDQVGRHNTLLGKSGGMGWNDSQLKGMSKWLSTQDRTWYSGGQMMKQDDLQSTIKSAEMSGYFFNTVDTDDFKRKVTKLTQDTREIVKTMHMAHEEAAAILGELTVAGYGNAGGTIKQMNRVSAMTGLSFGDIKNFSTEFANQQYSTYGTPRETAANVALDIASKYNKTNFSGAMGEQMLMNRATTSPGLIWGAMKYNPATGSFMADTNAMNSMATMDPIQMMNFATSKMDSLMGQVGGDPGKFGTLAMQLQAMGPSALQGADSLTLQRFYLGTAIAPQKLALSAMDPNGWGALFNKGGDDPMGWYRGANAGQRETMTSLISRQFGMEPGMVRNMLKGNMEGVAGSLPIDGPLSLEDISVPNSYVGRGKYAWDKDIMGAKENISWYDVSRGEKYNMLNLNGQEYTYDMGNTEAINLNASMGRFAGRSMGGDIMYHYAANQNKWSDEVEALQTRMRDATGIHRYDWNAFGSTGRDMMLYMESAAGTRYRQSNMQTKIQNDWANYYEKTQGLTSADARIRAGNLDISAIQDVVTGNYKGGDEAFAGRWQGALKMLRGRNMWTGKGPSGTEEEILLQKSLMGIFNTVEGTGANWKRMADSNSYDPTYWSPEMVAQHGEALTRTKFGPNERYLRAFKDDTMGRINAMTSVMSPDDAEKFRETFSKLTTGHGPKSKGKAFSLVEDISGIIAKYPEATSFEGSGAFINTLQAMGNKNVQGVVAQAHWGNLANTSLTAGTEIMGHIASSNYSDLLTGGGMNYIYGQLSDKSSMMYRLAQSDEGRQQIEGKMMGAMQDSARRSGRSLGAADIRNLKSEAQAIMGNWQNDQGVGFGNVASEVAKMASAQGDTSQSMMQIQNSTEATAKVLKEVSQGNVLNVITRKEKWVKTQADAGTNVGE